MNVPPLKEPELPASKPSVLILLSADVLPARHAWPSVRLSRRCVGLHFIDGWRYLIGRERDSPTNFEQRMNKSIR